MTTNNTTDTDPRELARIAATSETPPALVVYAIPDGDGNLASALGVDGLRLTDVLNVLRGAVATAIEMAETERDGSDDA